MSNPGPAASEEVVNAPFSLPSNRRCGRQENEPRRGMARWRGSGHGYYFLLRKSCLTEAEKLLTNSATFFLQVARRVENRHAGTGLKELVLKLRTLAAGTRAAHAAFSIFSRLEVTHVNFLFLLFAHITFLSCVFGFGLCQSRRIVAVPLRPSRLGSGRPNGSAFLSNASAVEFHAPQNPRPSYPVTTSQAPL